MKDESTEERAARIARDAELRQLEKSVMLIELSIDSLKFDLSELEVNERSVDDRLEELERSIRGIPAGATGNEEVKQAIKELEDAVEEIKVSIVRLTAFLEAYKRDIADIRGDSARTNGIVMVIIIAMVAYLIFGT